jgi:hypothetical protein
MRMLRLISTGSAIGQPSRHYRTHARAKQCRIRMVMLVVRHGVEPDPARQYQTSDIAIMPILEIICATQQFNLGRYVMEFEYSGIPARTGRRAVAIWCGIGIAFGCTGAYCRPELRQTAAPA